MKNQNRKNAIKNYYSKDCIIERICTLLSLLKHKQNYNSLATTMKLHPKTIERYIKVLSSHFNIIEESQFEERNGGRNNYKYFWLDKSNLF